MVRIKVVRLSQIIYIVLAAVLAIAAIVLLVRALPARAETGDSQTSLIQPMPAESRAQPSGDSMAPETAPNFSPDEVSKPSGNTPEKPHFLSVISRVILGLDVTDPRSILESTGFTMETSTAEGEILAESEGYQETEHEDPSIAPEIIQIEVGEPEPYEPPTRVDALRALIYHTHTQEAYEQVSNDAYVETAKWRTKDESHSIAGVGALLSQELAQRGFEVLHDLTDFEPPKLGYAYERSLAMLNRYVAECEKFDLYIDLHRDAYSKSWIVSGEDKTTVTIDGKECARIMLLIGNGEGTGAEGGFKIKPNWKENYKLASALTDELNAAHPSLARTVMVKTGRYNQHISTNAILIEVGHNLNTLEQAQNTMPYLAEALAKVMR